MNQKSAIANVKMSAYLVQRSLFTNNENVVQGHCLTYYGIIIDICRDEACALLMGGEVVISNMLGMFTKCILGTMLNSFNC